MELDYSKITSELRGMMTRIKNKYEEFSALSFSLDDEQSFLKSNALNSDNDLFLVAQYGEASTSLGSCVLALTITALGTANELSAARDFLARFATDYNLKTVNELTLNINTPSVSSNFNEAGNGYRSLCTVSALLLFSQETINFGKVTYTDDDGNEAEIPVLNFQDQMQNSLAPQVYGNTNGRTKSYAISQTYTFTIVTYSINNALIRKVNEVKYGDGGHENDVFVFTFALSNGQGFKKWKFHLSNATYAYSIGNIDGINLTFTL